MIDKPTVNEIVLAISQERSYQNRKWGSIDERPHTVREWLAIMEGEIEEAKEAWMKLSDEDCLREILQIVAVGFACLEQHGVVER